MAFSAPLSVLGVQLYFAYILHRNGSLDSLSIVLFPCVCPVHICACECVRVACITVDAIYPIFVCNKELTAVYAAPVNIPVHICNAILICCVFCVSHLLFVDTHMAFVRGNEQTKLEKICLILINIY